jgi:hypothetical protein
MWGQERRPDNKKRAKGKLRPLPFPEVKTASGSHSASILRRIGFKPVLLSELLYPARGIDQFLLARKEGVAVRTDIDVNSGNSRTGLDNRSTGTVDCRFLVFGMDTLFHNILSIESPL